MIDVEEVDSILIVLEFFWHFLLKWSRNKFKSLTSAQTARCQQFNFFAKKRNSSPGNIWDWKYLSMLPVEEDQDRGIFRSEASGNQESDRRVMM